MKDNAIFYHMYCINNFKELFNKSFDKIKTSGLYDQVQAIHVTVMLCGVGKHANLVKEQNIDKLDEHALKNSPEKLSEITDWLNTKSSKITITSYTDLDELDEQCRLGNELVTLRHLYNYKEKYKNILYLHSKGVTLPDNINVQHWVNYMEHFTINNWETCMGFLEEYDTCGVELRNIPMKHYSGNFWWVSTKYLNNHVYPDSTNSTVEKWRYHPRRYSEFWLHDTPEQICNPVCMNNVGHRDLYKTVEGLSKYST